MHELSIGQLARRTHVSASAIRYYERLGLLPTARRVGGKRRFDASDVARLALIRLGQATGFSLDEISTLLEGAEGGKRASQRLSRMAETKLPEVQEKLRSLKAMERMLKGAKDCCCPSLDACLVEAEKHGWVSRPE